MTNDEEIQNKRESKAVQRATKVSILTNIVMAIIQFTIGIISGAASLIADAFHSLSDLISDFVVLLAKKYSQMDADADHPYGHHRFENGASLFLGLILLAVAIGMIFSAVHKIEHYNELHQVDEIALWVACFSVLAKELLFRYMLKEAKQVRSSLLIANAWHARSDAASSLVVALGIIGNLSGYEFLDPVAAIIVGFIIGKMGVEFSWNALQDLMDRSADEETLNDIRQIILQTAGVEGLHGLKARKMGDLLLIDVHIEVDGKLTVSEGHDIALDATNRVLSAHQVINVMTHVDPV